MRTTLALTTALAAALAASAAALEAPLDVRRDAAAKFTAEPKAARTNGTATISFAVDKATDVEVAVLNSRGEVVRHLAAGLLGKNAPAPLRKNSLSQEFKWDMRDDVGKPASGGPFSARVRLGSSARLEKIVGRGPNYLPTHVVGLTVGRGGEVYALTSEGSRGRSILYVIDKTGKYLRTIAPYPADTPEKRLKTVGVIKVDGKTTPILFSGHAGNVVPLMSGMKHQTMCFSPKGYVVALSAVGTIVEHGSPRYLIAFHPEGGAPEGVNFVGPMLRKPRGMLGGSGEGFVRARDNVACDPEGQYFYVTMTLYRRGWQKWGNKVYRMKWDDPQLSTWLGKNEPGSDDAHFSDPQGLAVDAKGNVYVADRLNNRVMIFDASRKLLGKFAVPNPEQIFVHRKTGEIYLTSRRIDNKYKRPARGATIRKYSAWKPGATPKEMASLPTKSLGVIAVDCEATPARIWAGSYGITLITDGGSKFAGGERLKSDMGLSFPTFMAADPVNKRVIVDETFANNRNLTVVTADGKRKSKFVKGTDVAVDRDGNVYVLNGYGTNSFSRYDSKGKPLPFTGTGSHTVKCGVYRGYGPNIGMRGIEVAPNGDTYVFRSNNYGLKGGRAAVVDCFGADGKHKKRVVDGLGHGDCGLGVDARGNVYVGVNVRPAASPLPPALKGQVPAKGWRDWRRGKRERPWSLTYYNPYLFHLGSVMKFPPSGGTMWGNRPNGIRNKTPRDIWDPKKAPAGAVTYKSAYLHKTIKVQGAAWRYPECGIVPASDLNWGDPCCMCMTSDLDADPYGRVYVPNCARFTVDRLDTAGNLIERVGGYGNADSAGPKSRVPKPEIGFVSPANVDVAGDKLYVSDWVNQRITVVRFDWAAEKVCRVP
jgi:hypothetical protein